MDETFNNGEKKKGAPKGLIAIIIAAVLVVGGSAAAFVLLNFSAKEQYFLAEKNSLDFIVKKFEERYQPELDWVEQSEENATESTLELSAEYNDPFGGGGNGTMDPSQIINNSTITITSSADMENEQMAAELKANIGGMEIDDVNFYLTSEKVMLGLPFINELLQIKDDDLGSLLHEVDPATFTGEEKLGLDTIFEGSNGFLSEEDQEYFKEEYVEMIYDDLPEDAFESSEETIQVHDESLDTEKITLHLTEDQLKDKLSKTFEKMQKDDRLKEIIREQFAFQQVGGSPMDSEIDQFISEFETAMVDAIEGLEDFQIPGLTSTIWIHDDLIAQRDFQVEMGPSSDELVSFTVKGTQLLQDNNQSFNYDLGFSDAYDEGTLNVSGDLVWEDNKATDSINLTVDGLVLSYEGSETLNDGNREFERVFSMEDPFGGPGGSIIWDGTANYDNDQMNSEHNFSVESPEINQDMFALQVMIDAQTIDSVEMPNEDNVKDLGSMNVNELMEFFELEVTPQFQQWMFGILAGSGNLEF